MARLVVDLEGPALVEAVDVEPGHRRLYYKRLQRGTDLTGIAGVPSLPALTGPGAVAADKGSRRCTSGTDSGTAVPTPCPHGAHKRLNIHR